MSDPTAWLNGDDAAPAAAAAVDAPAAPAAAAVDAPAAPAAAAVDAPAAPAAAAAACEIGTVLEEAKKAGRIKYTASWDPEDDALLRAEIEGPGEWEDVAARVNRPWARG